MTASLEEQLKDKVRMLLSSREQIDAAIKARESVHVDSKVEGLDSLLQLIDKNGKLKDPLPNNVKIDMVRTAQEASYLIDSSDFDRIVFNAVMRYAMSEVFKDNVPNMVEDLEQHADNMTRYQQAIRSIEQDFLSQLGHFFKIRIKSNGGLQVNSAFFVELDKREFPFLKLDLITMIQSTLQESDSAIKEKQIIDFSKQLLMTVTHSIIKSYNEAIQPRKRDLLKELVTGPPAQEEVAQLAGLATEIRSSITREPNIETANLNGKLTQLERALLNIQGKEGHREKLATFITQSLDLVHSCQHYLRFIQNTIDNDPSFQAYRKSPLGRGKYDS